MLADDARRRVTARGRRSCASPTCRRARRAGRVPAGGRRGCASSGTPASRAAAVARVGGRGRGGRRPGVGLLAGRSRAARGARARSRCARCSRSCAPPAWSSSPRRRSIGCRIRGARSRRSTSPAWRWRASPFISCPSSDIRPLSKASRRAPGAVAVIRAFAPLPRTLNPAAPTTGYDDVKRVALARLVVDNIAVDSGGLVALRPEAGAGGADGRRRRCGRRVAGGRRRGGAPACAARGDPAEHPRRRASSRSSATGASTSSLDVRASDAACPPGRRRLPECPPARLRARRVAAVRPALRRAVRVRRAASRRRDRRRADPLDRIPARRRSPATAIVPDAGDRLARPGRLGRALHDEADRTTSGRSRWTPARGRRWRCRACCARGRSSI